MANRMRHQITDYERILRDYHKASFRHVVVFEVEISEDDKRHLFCQVNLLRQCGNELLGIMKRRLEQLLRTKRYRGLRKYYGSLNEKLKALEKVDVSVEALKGKEHPVKQEYSFSYTYHFSRTSVYAHHKEERRLFYEDTDDQF